MGLGMGKKAVTASLLCGLLCTGFLAASLSRAPAQTIAPKPADEAAPSRFRIAGKVVDSITGAPVARAQVTASPMNGRRTNGRNAGNFGGQRFGDQSASETTGPAGEFSITVPRAGGWRVEASAHGYHSQAYQEHDGFSTAIVLTEAEPVYRITFPLPPGAVIEGYVLDEAGEAVRNAQVTLSQIPPVTPESASPRPQQRGRQATDDRGFFKFSGLTPGAYVVRVEAQPWYATHSSQFGQFGGFVGGVVAQQAAAQDAAPDPLDVAYPTTWYPGVTEYAAAGQIVVQPGETREADMRLSPVPGFSLRLPNTAPKVEVVDGMVRRQGIQYGASLTRLLPDGTESGVPVPMVGGPSGDMEFSGLAPGTYVLHRNGERGPEAEGTTTVEIDANGSRTVDVTQGTAATLVTVRVDPAADSNSLQVGFRNVETDRVVYAQRPRDQIRPVRRGGAAVSAAAEHDGAAKTIDRTVALDPGKYEVVLYGGGDIHLTGIEATGAAATGRTVTITGGAPTMVVHTARGRATVTGFVQSHGQPDAGAMVLLVPATLGDPAGLNVTRRDQSNTDGSFDINAVLPGAYILIAIDRGWEVKWNDPATLQRYLMQGVPVDLSKPAAVTETVEAQAP